MKKKTAFFWLFISLLSSSDAQVVSTSPHFFGGQDSITITFDAILGNSALAGFSQTIYAHTGVITNVSNNWRYVKSAWGVVDPAVQMTNIGNDKYQISFVPRTYYGVPSNEVIKKIAILFRDASGNIVARNGDGSDMFIDLVDSTKINCAFVAPNIDPGSTISVSGTTHSINVIGIADSVCSLSILLNGSLLSSVNDDSINVTLTSSPYGNNIVQLIAVGSSTSDTASFSFIHNLEVQTAPLPAGIKDGVTYVNDSTIYLNLTAPFKNFVYVVGDFNNYTIDTNYFMYRTPDSSRYWLQINGLTPGREYTYQYVVDGNLKIADPYSEKILDPDNDGGIDNLTYPNRTIYPTGLTRGIVSVLQTGQVGYSWNNNSFIKPAKTDLVIYELLVRDFLIAHNYQGIIDTLTYLKKLGANAIELMPVNDFDGNNSWGYAPAFLFAPDKYYGTKAKLKELIDTCHSNGIAVIMDIVLNHQCGNSPMVQLYFNNTNGKPAANNPWFNVDATHDFNVCYDMNHDSPFTRYYVDRVTDYWVNEFHFDGFRFDLAKGFTQTYTLGNITNFGHYDSTRVYNIERMASRIRSTDSTTYVILELFADNNEEQRYVSDGMMVWGNMNYNYGEAARGQISNSNFSGVNYKYRSMAQPGVIGYMESHDEERLMFKNISTGINTNLSYNLRDTSIALSRMELAGAFFFTVPGPKMIWMGEELGYDVSINNPCRLCNHPFKWNYASDARRDHLFKIWSAIIFLRNNYPAFHTTNFNLQVSSAGKTIHINDPSMNVTVVGNFDINVINVNPVFQSTGWWYDYLSGDSIQVSNVVATLPLNPGEFHIYTSVRIPTSGFFSGIDETITENKFAAIFPNPTVNSTTLQIILQKSTTIQVKIFSMNGNLIKEIDLGKLPFGTHEISLEMTERHYQAGIYLCKIIAGEKVQYLKMVIQ